MKKAIIVMAMLLFNGIGTLLYLFLCKGRIPAYLGSSFAFISPVMLIISQSGYNHAQSGFIVFGLLFMLFSFIILVPAFALMKDMNPRGKRVCTAFFVGGTCVFGGHLSYAAAQEPDYLVPMIAGKLTAAVLGAALMLVLERKTEKSEKTEKISKTS